MTEPSQKDIELVIRPASGYAAAGERQLERLADALPALGAALRDPVNALYEKFSEESASKPSEIQLNFGLTFEGKGNWAVVSFSGAGTLSLTITWKA